MGVKTIAALKGQKLMRGKSVSGHYFSGVECNFRFSRVFFRDKENPGFVGHPADTKGKWASKSLYLPKTTLRHKLFAIAKNDALRP